MITLLPLVTGTLLAIIVFAFFKGNDYREMHEEPWSEY